MTDTSIWQVLRYYAEQGMTPDEVVNKFLARSDAHALLVTLVPWVVRHEQRGITNEHENRYRSELHDPDIEVRNDARKKLNEDGFWIPSSDGGGYVRYHDATAAQLRARARWYRMSAATFVAKAEMLELMADDIERAGVTCLRELLEGKDNAA